MDIDFSFDVPETFNMATLLVDRHVEEGRGDRVAIYSGDERITYRELQRRVNRAGNMLRNEGIEIEDRVIILMSDRPEFVETYVGSMKMGAVPVPVNTTSPPEDLAYYVEDSRAAAVVADEAYARRLLESRARFRYLKRIFVITESGSGVDAATFAEILNERGRALSYREAFAAASDGLETEPTSRDDPSYWLYSSGTTGRPKGTVHLHQDMVYCTATWLREVSKPTAADINFSVSKLFTSYGLVNGLYQPLMGGFAVVLQPAAPNPQVVVDTVKRHRPTILFTVPTMYTAILNEHEGGRLDVDLSSVRMCVSAGDALPAATYKRWLDAFGLELLDGIGSTEFGYIYIQNMPGRAKPGTSGQLLPGYAAKILDEDGHPVPQGQVGELYMQSESFAAYYWKKRDKTRDTFRGPWLKTGDQYSVDADGYFRYGARADDMFKANAQWVSPIEVEGILLGHRAVAEVAVVPFKDEKGDTRARAHVVLRQGYTPNDELKAELRKHCEVGLPDQYLKWPRRIEFESEPLPKTASGKIQRYKLRQRD
jgi:benzoate-CoA ligase family protein